MAKSIKKSSLKRKKSRKGKRKTKSKITKSKKNRIGSEPSGTYSEKSEGPMGWNSEKLLTEGKVPTKVADRTQQQQSKSHANSNAGGEQTSNDISLKLSAQISRIRKKRKQRILKYWNTVLEAINEVERDRRTRKKPQLDDAEGVPMLDTTVADTEPKNEDEDDDENPWEATNINKTSSFNEWLLKARATLPSAKGEVQSRDPFKGTTILDGKYYRQFKAAKNRVYAKCALTDDDAQTECDYEEHLKEVVIAGSSAAEYRNKFNYFEELEIIKSFPVSMNKKRLMYRYLNAEATQFQKTQKGCRCKLRCYPCCYCLFLSVSRIVYDIAPTLMLWKVPIHNMYAYFGVEVLYYFLWLRKIFVTQLFYAFLTLCIIVIPAYNHSGHKFHDEYLVKTAGVQPFTADDLLHGGGWFQTSFAFYGGFPHSKGINDERDDSPINTFKNGAYRLLVLWLTLVLANTLIIVFRIFFYRHRQLSTSRSGESISFFNTIFCSWEFSVNSVQLSASVQQAISKEFSLLNSHLTGDAHKAYNYNDKGRAFKRYIIKVPYGLQIYHLFVHIATIAISMLTSVLAFQLESFLIDARDDEACGKASRFDYKEVKYFWVRGCYFSFLFNIVSPIIVYLSDVELWYKRRYRNYVVIGRLSFLYIANYITLFAFWWSTSVAWQTSGRCYENTMCEAFYQILIWEFIITTIYWIVKDVLLNFIFWKCSKTYTAPELSMDITVVSLIFRHALLSGVVQFAPLLSLISMITNWITFYVKKTILYWIYSHPKYFVHVSDFELPYFMCYYIFFIVQTFCNLHLLFRGRPSKSCGVYQLNYTIYDTCDPKAPTYWYTKPFDDMDPRKFAGRKIIWVIIKQPAIGYAIFGIVCGTIYVMKKWGDAYKTTLETKKQHLQLEKRDRILLLRAIYNCSKAADGDAAQNVEKEMTESDREAEVVHLTLDKRNIFKAKVRTLAALIVGGKVHELSGRYKNIQELRQQLLDDFEAQTPPEETPDQRKARLFELKRELASEVITPTKEEVEARRQSMAARMMMNTESIKLIHKQEFQRRQRRWNEDRNPKNK